MDIQKLNTNLQTLKEQLRTLMAVSAELIDRNSQIDNGARCDNLQPLPKFELLLEDFLSTCNTMELSLRTIQECLNLGKACLQNLPITMSNLEPDVLDGRTKNIEPNTNVSYNQYLSVIRYQVDTARALRTLIEDFVNQQSRLQQQQQQQHSQQQIH